MTRQEEAVREQRARVLRAYRELGDWTRLYRDFPFAGKSKSKDRGKAVRRAMLSVQAELRDALDVLVELDTSSDPTCATKVRAA
jgi:hypothetical protein